MATIRQGILGGFSGKVANIVGSSWKGIAIMKSKPLSVANPRTTAQVAQRTKLTGCVAAARILLAALIQPFWNPFAQRQSGYNAFVGENIDTFATGSLTVPADFYATRGSLLGIVGASVAGVSGTDTITFDWDDNSGQADALATDEIVAVVYNETQDYWLVSAGDATRVDETLAITDTRLAASDVIRGYISAARPNVSKVADSVYQTATAS
jgi:hypothetical protein